MAQRLGQTQLVELLLEQVPVCNAETSAAVKGADLAPLYGATRRSSCARARPERAQRAGPASGPSLGVALSESWRPKRRAGGARTAGGSTAGEVGMRTREKLEEILRMRKSRKIVVGEVTTVARLATRSPRTERIWPRGAPHRSATPERPA